jgi:phosphatidylglycerophosphate synthase
MLDAPLRAAKDSLLLPFARALGPAVHPNLVSLVGFGVGLGCALLLLRGAYLPALLLWALNRVLDGLDGALARHWGRQSDFGGYLDLLLDFAVYALIPLCLALGAPEPQPALLPALGALLGSFYLNAASWMFLAAVLEKRALGAAARGERTSIAMPTGLVEGTETILFFASFMLLPGALVPLFAAMAALVLLTVAQRLLWAARHL